jgi:thioredoxin reductase
MGMPGRESFETIAGCKTCIMRDGQGAPLLYLHGGMEAPTWAPFFARLAENFDVIVRTSGLRRLGHALMAR